MGFSAFRSIYAKNAHAERFVLSAKSACLARIIPLGAAHLRTAVHEYIEHHHFERNHQGLANEIVAPRQDAVARSGPLWCRERLGGTLNFCYWEAA